MSEINQISTSSLILSSLGAIILLLILVMKVRLHAFIALLLVSMLVGLFVGIPIQEIPGIITKGMSSTIGFLSVVVALGAMFGQILDKTGALDQIANKLLHSLGKKRSAIAIGFIGLICALPLFFDVAIVLLIGMVFSITKKNDGNLVKTAVPLFAGVAAAAAFLLPGPTPILLADQLNADYGYMLLFGIVAALIGMLLAGPVFASFISKKVFIPISEKNQLSDNKINDETKLPSLGISLSLILLPLVLVALPTISKFILDVNSNTYHVFQFIGHPFVAILFALLIAIYGIAKPRGMNKEQILDICNAALQPAGIIILVTGAGGVFKQVLIDSGVGPRLGELLMEVGLPIALACFLLAASVRVIQGSATVACLTTVGLVLPLLETANYSGGQLAALAICIGGGSIVLSHVNDSGFWLFNKFTGATELQTLKTWTIMETILGTTGAIVGMIFFSLL